MNPNNSHLDTFKGVTSLQELNIGVQKMKNNQIIDDFSDEDKVENQVNFWKYQEEPEIIGLFNRFEKDKYGEHSVLKVGDEEVHLPNLTALNGKLKQANVSEDSKVKVKYKGEFKSEKSGRYYRDFEVYAK